MKELVGESSIGKNLPDAKLKSILRTYETSLAIPSRKPPVQYCICPIGLIGAGKTTVVKPLSKKLSLLRISTDEIRKVLKENGYNYLRVQELALILLMRYFRQGYSLAIDANCADPKIVKKIKSIAKEGSIKIIWIHIKPPEKFILHKLKTYKHTWLFKDGEEAVQNYLARKKLHRVPKFKFIYTFDTSKANLDEQIKKAVVEIKAILINKKSPLRR